MTAQDLKRVANDLRIEVLKMVYRAQSGHIAGPLSSAEIFAVLYLGGVAKVFPSDPWNEERDRIVLSAGHYCPILYATLSRAGYFHRELLDQFGRVESLLGVHPEHRLGGNNLPGVEVSSGPLGQGVSVACGMALALKLKYGERPQQETPRVYCVMSDGEMQEGQVWEAFNLATRRQLDNLIFILDRNRIQIEHYISEVASGDIVAKLEAFGLHTLVVDGNEASEVKDTIEKAKHVQGGPVVVVAETIASKGVKFMESDPKWHDGIIEQHELQRAILDLSADRNG